MPKGTLGHHPQPEYLPLGAWSHLISAPSKHALSLWGHVMPPLLQARPPLPSERWPVLGAESLQHNGV